MKVKMKTTARGAELNANVGDVVEVSAKIGKQLVEGNYAEPYTDPDEARAEAEAKAKEEAEEVGIETATAGPGETAAIKDKAGA